MKNDQKKPKKKIKGKNPNQEKEQGDVYRESGLRTEEVKEGRKEGRKDRMECETGKSACYASASGSFLKVKTNETGSQHV